MANPRGNPEYLKPPFTPEEARIQGAKGGAASGPARKRKKNLQELARALLETPVADAETRERLEKLGLEPTHGAELVAAMQSKAAKKGSERAAEFVRDTSGQAPKMVQQVIVGEGMSPDDIRALSDAELAAILAGED